MNMKMNVMKYENLKKVEKYKIMRKLKKVEKYKIMRKLKKVEKY